MEWIVIVAALLLGVPATAWFAQNRLIFFPQPGVASAHLPAEAKPLEIVAPDGVRLRGWMRVANATPAPVVVYFGGNAEEVSRTLVDPRWPRDWTIVAINYRGYGTSEGAPGEAALVADALVIFDTLAALPDVDARRIVAFGRSLGTGVAVRLASQAPASKLILVTPYDSMAGIAASAYPFAPVGWLLLDRYDSGALAPGIRMPTTIIAAENDEVIPRASTDKLLARFGPGVATMTVIPGVGHNGLDRNSQYRRTLQAALGLNPTP